MSLHDATRDLTSGEPWDCGDMACDLHDLGPRADESRAVWLARLRARFSYAPLPDAPNTGRPKGRYWITYVPCPVCGKQKRVGSACIGCVARGRGRRLVAV